MKKYFPLAILWLLFAVVVSSCAARHDTCGAYNRGGKSGDRHIQR
jgi:hypothetical protein